MDKLHNLVQQFLENESSGHDVFHAERVYKLALHIQRTEGGDQEIIGAAALVHDICRPFEKKTGTSHFGPEALAIIKDVLTQAELSKNQIVQVLDVVAFHDIYDWTEKMQHKSIELQVVQDADNLDAIGAIGIARTFMFGGHNNRPMYIPEEKLEFVEDFVDGKSIGESTVAHFYEKLLKLKQHMNTATGTTIAEERHHFMQQFLQQFFKEWEVKI